MPHNPAQETFKDHVALVEVAYDALLGLTVDGVVRTWNPAATRLFGYDASEAIGRPVSLIAEPDQHEEQRKFLENARAGILTGPIETTRRRRDGSRVAVEVTLMPVRDQQGRIVSLAGALRDISDKRKADSQRALVTNELIHRLKNTIARVQAIATQTLRDADSLDAFHTTFIARLAALSSSHDLLNRAVDEGVALLDLVTAELAPQGGAPGMGWQASGPSVFLPASQVWPFGMILHELATNAAKYGAFSTPAGRVQVSWHVTQIEGARRLILTWLESGGPVVEQPTRKGFGTRLVADCVAGELGGESSLAFERTGLTCRIDIPLPATACVPLNPGSLLGLSGGLQILVVEDEALIAMCVEDILINLGCKVVKAARIARGLQAIETQHIDGAFLDVDVCGLSILPIAESLRSRGIPFAFVTGIGREHVPDGFRDHTILSKPLVESRFADVLADFSLAPAIPRQRTTQEYT